MLAVAASWQQPPLAASCKRTWDNCYDPINGPTCNPTLEVVNCSNPPAPCNTPGYVVSGCSYCWSGVSPACGIAGSCQNAICYRFSTLAYGATIMRHRVYQSSDPTPGPWATPVGGPSTYYLERGKQLTQPVNYTWCNASMTPVVGIPGVPVTVDVELKFDDENSTTRIVSTTWRP